MNKNLKQHPRMLIFITFYIFSVNVISQINYDSSCLNVYKSDWGGYDCYTTPYFSICPSSNNLKGKILYLPSARYMKHQATLTICLLNDYSDNIIVKKLNEIIPYVSERNISIKIVGDPASFYVHENANIVSCIGHDWDGYEARSIIYIKFPLAYCIKEGQEKYKNQEEYFKKLIKECYFKKIVVECNNNLIEIPIEFPLNEIIKKCN